MDEPVQVSLSPELRRRARRRAAEGGLTLSEYIADLIAADLESRLPEPGASAVVPVSTDTPPDHQGTYIGEAVAARMNRTPDADPER